MCLTDDLYPVCFEAITPAERKYCCKQQLESHKCIYIYLTWWWALWCCLWQKAISHPTIIALAWLASMIKLRNKSELKRSEKEPGVGERNEQYVDNLFVHIFWMVKESNTALRENGYEIIRVEARPPLVLASISSLIRAGAIIPGLGFEKGTKNNSLTFIFQNACVPSFSRLWVIAFKKKLLHI